MNFVHLNTRSDYSLLLSTISTEKLVEKALDYDFPGMALTDVGNLFGAMEFVININKRINNEEGKYPQYAGKKFNPIIGMTVNVAEVNKVGNQEKFFKLILLAETMEGYRNLCRLSTLSSYREIPNTPNMDFVLQGKPFTTLEEIFQHAQGCIALTGGGEGEIFDCLLYDKFQEAYDYLGMLREGFGPNNVFVEIQNHNHSDEKKVIRELPGLATKLDLGLVATNQVCYLNENDRLSWNILYCIGEKRNLTLEGNQVRSDQVKALPGDGYHLRSAQEMKILFSHLPEALQNTLLINDRCHTKIIDKEKHMPYFPLEGKSPEQYLREESFRLLKDKCPSSPEYQSRLEYELSVIEEKNFSSYFIIVADLINYAHSQNIMVGKGRGSAAGSLVSYVMGITSLDPIAYGLYFERFLNPERSSSPDIDIDFQDDRRDEVIEYVRQRYGEEQVAQIISFSKLKTKAVFKDVARVFGIDFETTNNITKLIKTKLDEKEEEKRNKGSYLAYNLNHNNYFAGIINSRPEFGVIYEQALKLENLTRQTGIHAAGVVVADKPLVDYIPLLRTSSGILATQFDGSYLEKYCGLLKIDFLGITTLTVIQKCVEDIQKMTGEVVDISEPPLDDKKAFSMFSKGLTAGIFQFESDGMTTFLKQLRPENINELIAMNALYRPGPMNWIPLYIARKHGSPEIFHDEKEKRNFQRFEEICQQQEALKEVMSETRGIPFYQEQIMEICKIYAGFTLGEADDIRKAMGKKDQILIEKLRKDFIEGAVKLGNPSDEAKSLYDEIIYPFGGYGFNKSHSACYAYMAYQTAYLKANYPMSFMTAIFNSELDKSDSQASIYKYYNECLALGVRLSPPDINYSDTYFVYTGKEIIYGLAGIKHIGVAASKKIVAERKKNGEYLDLIDFLLRHPSDRVGKQTVEALIKSGCFDYTGITSEQWIKVLDEIQERLDLNRNQRHLGQLDLFQELGIDSHQDLRDKANRIPEDKAKAAILEREILGFNLSNNPTILYKTLLSQATTLDLNVKISKYGCTGYLGAVIVNGYVIKDRNNNDMARLMVSNGQRTLPVICFEKNWKRILSTLSQESQELNYEELIKWLSDRPLRLKLKIQPNRKNPSQNDLTLEELDILEIKEVIPKTATIRLVSNMVYDDQTLKKIEEVINRFPGQTSIKIAVDNGKFMESISLKSKVNFNEGFKRTVSRIKIVESSKVDDI